MRSVARFAAVSCYPETSFPDRLVGTEGGGHPLTDAFLRSSRSVAELYSEALVELGVEGPRATLRLSPGEQVADPGNRGVTVTVWSAEPHDLPCENGFVGLTTGTGLLDATDRARLALEVVHTAVLELARHRGWEPTQFERCRDHVLARGLEYSWEGRWTSAPDRRHRARAVYRLGVEDGFGRACLEVADRSGQVVARSDEAIAFCTSSGFRRSASTLRWSGSGAVSLTPYGGWPASGLVVGTRGDEGWAFDVRDDVTVRRPGGAGVTSGPSRAPVPAVNPAGP